MASPISSLSKSQRSELLEDLNYLNMTELKTFCKKQSIPFSIWIEAADGTYRRTKDEDRKGVILNRIRHYLTTGGILDPTRFPVNVISFAKPSRTLRSNDRLYYGQYDKKSRQMIALLKRLTGGRFRNGAIARIVAREFWSRGVAPTYQEYALAWLKAEEEHKRPNPEWAFLSDRAAGRETGDWKKLRAEKAKRVLTLLDRVLGARAEQ